MSTPTRMSTVTIAPAPARRRSKKPVGGWRWAGRGILVFLLLFTALPMVWMVITSLKTQLAALQYPPQWWPEEVTFENYIQLLSPSNAIGHEFLQYFWNSLYVSILSTILGVAVAV
ncbi:MAG: carbohydrate ABC transporter permease, partial [Rhizobiales bacterium]|nr:carbohydrate ABC transporter permease [Hyphomicrobiales bacterium]